MRGTDSRRDNRRQEPPTAVAIAKIGNNPLVAKSLSLFLLIATVTAKQAGLSMNEKS